MNKVSSLVILLLLSVVLIFSHGVSAQILPDWASGVSSESAREWADSIFEESLANGDFDAAVVSIVKGGETLYQAGYGIANAAERRPATASTPFRSGSVSKLFTTISILQLVEQGKLELDEDINRYLARGQVETVRGITTVRHLLTHTAGFEEKFRNTLVQNPDSERASADYMNRHAHLQVRNPGETISYSNHGMGIAGLIIEDVSGMTYGDYVAANLFQPLGMENAGVEFPGKLPEGIAQEHETSDDGSVQPRPLLYKQPFYLGSGGFFYSASDMASFMKAVLSRSPTLLNADSWDQALTMQMASGEAIASGIGLGFWIYEQAGESELELRTTIAAHGGSTEGFNSQLFLFPEQQIGLFFSVLSSDAGLIGSRFSTINAAWNFVETFRGYRQFVPFTDQSQIEVQDFQGVFLPNRRPYAGGELFFGNVTNSFASLRLSAIDGVLYQGDIELQRIGPRSFGRMLNSGRWTVVSFSEDLNTVWNGASSSFSRASAWGLSANFVPLTLILILVSLSSIVPLIWPGRRIRAPEFALSGAALLATGAEAAPFVALLVFGDHFRLESPRYAIQSLLGVCAAVSTAWAIWQMQKQYRLAADNFSFSVLAIHRALVAASLCGLIFLFIVSDIIRL